MTSTVRYNKWTNVSAPAGLDTTSPQVNSGDDFAPVSIEHTFIAEEIGTTAGKTQDTTSNPTTGFLFYICVGSPIQEVKNYTFQKNATVTNPNANVTHRRFVYGTAANFSSIVWGIDNSEFKTKGISRLYLIDQGDHADTRIAAGDTVTVELLLGRTL